MGEEKSVSKQSTRLIDNMSAYEANFFPFGSLFVWNFIGNQLLRFDLKPSQCLYAIQQ